MTQPSKRNESPSIERDNSPSIFDVRWVIRNAQEWYGKRLESPLEKSATTSSTTSHSHGDYDTTRGLDGEAF